MFIYPSDPAMNVVYFLHSIGSKIATTFPVAARIGQQNRVAVFEQQVSVSGHAFAIIGNSVQQDYCIAVVVSGMDKPSLKRRPIGCGDSHILQFSVEIRSHGCGNCLLMAQWKTREFEANIGYDDASQNRQEKISDETRQNYLTKNIMFAWQCFRACGRIHFGAESNLIPKDVRRRN